MASEASATQGAHRSRRHQDEEEGASFPRGYQVARAKLAQIEEFIKTGVIEEAEEIKRNERIASLRELTKVYGVGASPRLVYRPSTHLKPRTGPSTARELYDGKRTGKPCRSVADIREQNAFETKYHDDIALKIPRAEVEEIGREVNRHMQIISPGAIYEIVGGYVVFNSERRLPVLTQRIATEEVSPHRMISTCSSPDPTASLWRVHSIRSSSDSRRPVRQSHGRSVSCGL